MLRQHIGSAARVTDKRLKACAARGEAGFSSLAFDLYKEAASVVVLCNGLQLSDTGELVLDRNQAICAGLLVRIAKLMKSVMQLFVGSGHGEAILALNRSIGESAANLRLLAVRNKPELYDEFVRSALGAEREAYDQIVSDAKRRGEMLPIESRIISSIERVFDMAGLRVRDVQPRSGDWGGGMRQRLEALGEGYAYVWQFRIPSHTVHGTWVDLALHHLEQTASGLQPSFASLSVDARVLLPVSLTALKAARAYLQSFFRGRRGVLRPVFGRIDNLSRRIEKTDNAHEEWLAAS